MANEYRLQSDGSVKTKSEVIRLHSNTSIPKIWAEQVCSDLGIDPVFETPQPSASAAYKKVVRNGVEKDAKDNWVWAWVEQDMFATNDDATKAEQEAYYQAKLDAQSSAYTRNERDYLLAKTDWLGLSDTTMSAEWTTYRQSLRDIPQQDEFPHEVTWPTEPD